MKLKKLRKRDYKKQNNNKVVIKNVSGNYSNGPNAIP